MNTDRLRDIAKKYLDGTASEEEKHWLHEYYNEVSSEETETVIADQFSSSRDLGKEMLAGIQSKMAVHTPVRKIPVWKRIAVAASILLVIGLSSYFLFFNDKPANSNLPIAKINQPVSNDALPGKSGAILTTGDGTVYELENTNNGRIENLTAIKQDGKLSYEKTSASVEYHTMTTPKGRKFELVLPDGSMVWMDAGSSITYPTAFTGNERKITASGQLYFEVAKNAAMPFTVNDPSRGVEVEVLGTHFNFNTYADESESKVTLLEGSVNVNNTIIKPGQQAQIGASVKINYKINVASVMAWKNGLFNFDHADLATVLRQLSRWYDVEVIYEGKIPSRAFEGKIGRDLNLSQVLKGLEKVDVHFRIEGKKLIVMP